MRTRFLAIAPALVLLAAPAQAQLRAQPGAADAPNGTSDARQSEAMVEEDLRAELKAQGFTDIGDVTPVGALYAVKAARDGRSVSLLVNPDTGVVRVI